VVLHSLQSTYTSIFVAVHAKGFILETTETATRIRHLLKRRSGIWLGKIESGEMSERKQRSKSGFRWQKILDENEVGNRIKIAVLKAKGKNQTEIAAECDISKQRVNQLLQDIFKFSGEPAHNKVDTLGDRLRWLRTAAGLTLYQVEEATGCHYISVLRWEQNKIIPTLDSFTTLITLYGADAHWVIFGQKYCLLPEYKR
jgi:transcriptional regulator with XRE-family HTH domain